ncbi:MAG: hypothetical protein NTW85_00995 [Methylococcales bacterium]|nr:hypothetical protein [Methylococcales bacterium]
MTTQQNQLPKTISSKTEEKLITLQHQDGQQHNFKQPKQPFPFGGSFGYSESRYKKR